MIVEGRLKKFPKEMKRMSKTLSLTRVNIDRIPDDAHGVYIMFDKDDKALYVGIQ